MSDVLSSAIAFALVSIHSSGTYRTHVPDGASATVDAYTSVIVPSSFVSTSPSALCIPHSYAQVSNDDMSRGAVSDTSISDSYPPRRS